MKILLLQMSKENNVKISYLFSIFQNHFSKIFGKIEWIVRSNHKIEEKVKEKPI